MDKPYKSHTLAVCHCGKIAYPSEGWAKLGALHWNDTTLIPYRSHGVWHLKTKEKMVQRKKERYKESPGGKAKARRSLLKFKEKLKQEKRRRHLMSVKAVLEALIIKMNTKSSV